MISSLVFHQDTPAKILNQNISFDIYIYIELKTIKNTFSIVLHISQKLF